VIAATMEGLTMIQRPTTSSKEGLLAAFFRFLDVWLHKSIESTGIVIVARSGDQTHDIVYQSRWSAGATWPVALAAQVPGGVIIEGYAAEPMWSGGRHLGALLVSRPDSYYASGHLAQIREAAELAASVIGSLPAPAADQR
jgi:hypothetical protein